MPGLFLVPEASYPDANHIWFSSVSPEKKIFKIRHNCFHPHPPRFIIQLCRTIWLCNIIFAVQKASFNKLQCILTYYEKLFNYCRIACCKWNFHQSSETLHSSPALTPNILPLIWSTLHNSRELADTWLFASFTYILTNNTWLAYDKYEIVFGLKKAIAEQVQNFRFKIIYFTASQLLYSPRRNSPKRPFRYTPWKLANLQQRSVREVAARGRGMFARIKEPTLQTLLRLCHENTKLHAVYTVECI
jgi:hypothetical protein